MCRYRVGTWSRYTVPLAMLRTTGSHGCFGWIVMTRIRSPCLQKTIVAKLWLAIPSTSSGKLWRRSQIMTSSLLNNQIMANLWYTLCVKNQLVKETLTCQKQYMFGRSLSFTQSWSTLQSMLVNVLTIPHWSVRLERAEAVVFVYMYTVTHSQSSAPFMEWQFLNSHVNLGIDPGLSNPRSIRKFKVRTITVILRKAITNDLLKSYLILSK